ncbi:MAG: pyrroline-5-carboxylate reductase [Planctomycetota bacterium]|nr:pyrroline-5-carboxylate reductase [Planctomycetota bacterium]
MDATNRTAAEPAPATDEQAPTERPGLAMVGCGNMGRAILLAGLRQGVLDPARTVVAERDAAKRAALAKDAGLLASGGKRVRIVGTARECAALAPAGAPMLLAIKPQMLNEVASELIPVLGSWVTAGGRTPLVISILAGATSAGVRAAMGGGVRVVRVMPNLPMSIGLGATAIAHAAPDVTPAEFTFARRLFESSGVVEELPEDLIDAFTAIAGSGPAYAFFLAEAMIAGAIALGVEPQAADRIVRQTLRGSAEMLSRAGESPEQLRLAVTSKGGTTAAAIAVLEAQGVMGTWVAALRAARDRGKELGRTGG